MILLSLSLFWSFGSASAVSKTRFQGTKFVRINSTTHFGYYDNYSKHVQVPKKGRQKTANRLKANLKLELLCSLVLIKMYMCCTE